MSEYKDSDGRDQISENEEKRMTNDIEVLQLGKFRSKKNDDNIEKEDDEINRMDTSDNKYSDEIDKIDKTDEERVTNDIEVLKLGNFGSQKNIDNVEQGSYEIKKINMIDNEESDERQQIG